MHRAMEEPGLWDRLRERITPPVSIAESAARHRALYDELLHALDDEARHSASREAA
jgi:hypothetical protein